MADVKISAGADPGTVVATDKVPMARSASTTAYAATMAELATYANGAYVPNYYTGTPSMDGTGAAGTVSFVSRGDHVHPSDTARVAKAGDTMGGFLTLNANPTANLHAATKQYVDGSAPVGGPYLSVAAMHDVGRNLIHNAGFTVAQRGVGPWTANGNYTADRWVVQDTTDTVSFTTTTISDAGRSQIGDESAVRCLQNTFTGNAAAGAYNAIEQRVESVRRLAGQSVTVSFWAIAGVAGVKLGLNMYQVFGSGGSPSAPVVVLATGNAATLTTGWARYSFTVAIPSAAGKTFGTNGDDCTYLRFFYSSGATNNAQAGNIGVQSGTIQLWGVQLEIGSVATPLEKRDPEQELRQCQRFYIRMLGSILGYIAASGAVGQRVTLPTTMRGTPTVTASGGSPLNTSGAITADQIDAQGFRNFVTSTAAGLTAVDNFTITASADL